ncbi:pseudouridine synthase [Marinobacter segnicrescens]|uniref:Pseudouridine synthase n=1 Tax=Marinobacter segnicrescens TaxID=430453 RepID=A0A1I0CUZ4_9GAMM|nr:pseudouridine synthase [Marinobacter segnicrescens]SET23635.1 16S rRNA pseudouridine516 synthase [Marinobacter segnicrescens]
MKLSRILSNENGVSRKQANQSIATGMVMVDGQRCSNASAEVSRFQQVTSHGKIIQQGAPARYLMLNKPAGYLSATRDAVHRTVMDLLPTEWCDDLHIAGRLDRATTGLLILTNDGNWSRNLTDPLTRVPKVYRVTTAYPLSPDTESRFAAGIWFAWEGLTTSPAVLEQLAHCEARLTIFEGRYHQVKRMFHAVGNRVTGLHRERVGDIVLPDDLPPGTYRHLSDSELQSVPHSRDSDSAMP